MNDEQPNTVMNFDISGLVIHGLELTSRQQRQLSRAFETSLRQLFEVGGIPESMSTDSVAAGVPVKGIQLTSETVQPVALGRQIANSIYDGLSK